MFDIPASTLRYYEEIRLLPAVEKTEAKQRIYTEEHINRLGALCCFKETGMSMALLKEQEEHVAKQIEKLKSAQKQISRKLSYYSDIKASMDSGSDCPDWADY